MNERITELEQQMKDLRDRLDNHKGIIEHDKPYCKPLQKELILVPDCIKIEGECTGGDGLGIVFNKGKKVLSYDGKGFYNVNSRTLRIGEFGNAFELDFIQCKLTPCKREDLKEGDTAFCSNDELEEIDKLKNYCKILDDYTNTYIDNDRSPILESYEYDNWYKVERA